MYLVDELDVVCDTCSGPDYFISRYYILEHTVIIIDEWEMRNEYDYD